MSIAKHQHDGEPEAQSLEEVQADAPGCSCPASARRIEELEARVDELETLIAGASAVLRAAEV